MNFFLFDLQYGIIKYSPNNDSLIVMDKNRNILYDSSIGSFNIESLSLRRDLSSQDRYN